MSAPFIGYARVSRDAQDLTAQGIALASLGVTSERIYVDHGLTGTNRERPGLREALAACRKGDTLVVTELDRAGPLGHRRSGHRRGTHLLTRQVEPGRRHLRPTDPVGRLLFNVLAMVAEFEADPLSMRTREGLKVANAKGRLRGKRPKLTVPHEAHLAALHAGGEYTPGELAELFRVGRSTVYRALVRVRARNATTLAGTFQQPDR